MRVFKKQECNNKEMAQRVICDYQIMNRNFFFIGIMHNMWQSGSWVVGYSTILKSWSVSG